MPKEAAERMFRHTRGEESTHLLDPSVVVVVTLVGVVIMTIEWLTSWTMLLLLRIEMSILSDWTPICRWFMI